MTTANAIFCQIFGCDIDGQNYTPCDAGRAWLVAVIYNIMVGVDIIRLNTIHRALIRRYYSNDILSNLFSNISRHIHGTYHTYIVVITPKMPHSFQRNAGKAKYASNDKDNLSLSLVTSFIVK